MPLDPASGSRRAALTQDATRALDARSVLATWFFGKIFERAMRRHFHAMRVSRAGPPPAATARLVVYTNHPSWWDACVYIVVAARLFPGLVMRAPMDAAMITKYPFMPKIGLFGVAQGDGRGSAAFLAICRAIFQRPNDLLMVAAQGRFADVRERPVALQAGIAHLPALSEGLTFVPLAIDYCFWSERGGEALLRFGQPLAGDQLAPLKTADRLARLEASLAETMDALATEAIARDPAAFRTILSGRRGADPIFDTWRRVKAAMSGRRYDVGHGAPP